VFFAQLHNDSLNELFGFVQPAEEESAVTTTPDTATAGANGDRPSSVPESNQQVGSATAGGGAAGGAAGSVGAVCGPTCADTACPASATNEQHEVTSREGIATAKGSSGGCCGGSPAVSRRKGPLAAAEVEGSGIDISDVRLSNLRVVECIATRARYGSSVQRLRTRTYPGETSCVASRFLAAACYVTTTCSLHLATRWRYIC
jgi:hypothetical protein